MPAIPLLRADFGPPAPPPAPVSVTPRLLETGLTGYIRTCYQNASQNRRNLGVDDRMLSAMRALRGEYPPDVLAQIKEFGGSEIYARIVASKVRGCSALLREIYTATDRPWALGPTPEPSLNGPDLNQAVQAVLQAEAMEVMAAGQTPDPQAIKDRVSAIRDELQQMRRKKAAEALRTREASIDDVLWEGGFYEALWALLGDIATFPFAVLKGPVVRFQNTLVWKNGKPGVERRAMPKYERCSPFDVYFAPWAQNPQDGYMIHRERVSRAAVESMKGLRNYNEAALQAVLDNWGTGRTDWYDYNEAQRAELEQRESAHNPTYSSGANEQPQPMLSFYGSISRKMLQDWGMQLPKNNAPDLNVFAYLIGDQVVGVTLNPHPTGRLPFYVDSFERVPGSPYGNGIPDLLEDIAGVGNAALRALVNNLAIASGPMGWINEDRLAENDPNSKKLWPWKVWGFNDSNTNAGTEKPMEFFQPESNVDKLFTVYQNMLNMADEISTIPRYMQGSSQGIGGAGRTSSGLSMLMEAANRTIKQTVSSIDTNIVETAVEDLNVFLALTRPDIVMEGDISVVARGAVELMQRETLRMRRIEFLNITNNPVDQQITGVEGRAMILKEIARDLGLPTSETVPLSDEQIKGIQGMMTQQLMQQFSGGGATGNETPAPKNGQAQEQPAQPTDGQARQQSNSPGA